MRKIRLSAQIGRLVDHRRAKRWELIKQDLERSAVVVAGRFARQVAAGERLSYLREQLAGVREDHPSASPLLLSAIARIETRLGIDPVVLGGFRLRANSNVKPSIFNILDEELSPALTAVLEGTGDRQDQPSAHLSAVVQLSDYLKDVSSSSIIGSHKNKSEKLIFLGRPARPNDGTRDAGMEVLRLSWNVEYEAGPMSIQYLVQHTGIDA